jgi:hypothetical protein
LADQIRSGKKELSIGYKCVPDLTPGVYNGERYHVVQRDIRGNHFSLVDEGRSGADIAVRDRKIFIYDTKELKIMGENENENKTGDAKTCDEGALTLESLNEKIDRIAEAVAKIAGAEKSEAKALGDNESSAEEVKAKDTEETTESKDSEEEEVKDAEETKEKSAAMDARLRAAESEISRLKSLGIKSLVGEITKRDQLANKLSNHIGVFDHADKTLAEVAAYGVEKLGLKVTKGQELSALDGFFKGCAHSISTSAAYVMDSAYTTNTGSSVDKYIRGESN